MSILWKLLCCLTSGPVVVSGNILPGDSRLEISTPHRSVTGHRNAQEENVEMKPLIQGLARNGTDASQVVNVWCVCV